MRTPNREDIRQAVNHGRWLMSLRQPLTNTDRMLTDLTFEVERLRDEIDRLKAAAPTEARKG